ncbi:DUF397 domain-containing protein [Nocardiopsis valliformis]|uniref:DUF397 domain-containing protein n=1 Tax=Nocardiopsis valliformis TaxID=239974 RepID=UPI0003491E6A|nr:DUF397 domain-containing protein [Nocardiopsis valliformis]
MTVLEFKKSSYSGASEDCVEVAHIPSAFHKSSYSSDRVECVEVAELPCGAAVRDSKRPEAGHLPFPSSEWTGFLKSALNH